MTRNKKQLVEEILGTAGDLEASIVQDDGPARVKLPSGDYMEGEAADAWFTFHHTVIDMLKRLAKEVEDLPDVV